MGLVFGRNQRSQEQRYWGITGPGDLIPRRVATPGYAGGGYVNEKTAMGISAVWAAIRLRADIISTLPIDCFRSVSLDGGDTKQQIEAPLSPFMTGPDFMEFCYSSQMSLDSTGNAIGLIRAADKMNYPTEIELFPTSVIDVVIHDNQLVAYRIEGTEYTPEKVWHEKQFTAPGLHVGMSPIAYAAYSLGQYKSVQAFATQWFVSGNGPRASLKNVEKKINTKEATIVKEAWRASQSIGEPFVHGSDWEYNLIAAQTASNDWIESQKLTLADVSRFFGVPADLIDAALAGGPNVTYANVTQRNLQFLVMHLGPSIIRRENAFSQGLLPKPRFIKFNSDALLRMDPQTRALMIKSQIESRVLCPSEARAMDNRKPYTDDQIKEFELLGLNKTATGALAGADDLPVPAGTQTVPADPNAAAPAEPNPADNQGNK